MFKSNARVRNGAVGDSVHQRDRGDTRRNVSAKPGRPLRPGTGPFPDQGESVPYSAVRIFGIQVGRLRIFAVHPQGPPPARCGLRTSPFAMLQQGLDKRGPTWTKNGRKTYGFRRRGGRDPRESPLACAAGCCE